jgi:ABC-type uncharacterized transport system permease subunit
VSAVKTAEERLPLRLPGWRGLARSPLVIEQRSLPSPWIRIAVFGGSLLGALVAAGALLALTGYEPLSVYETMLRSSFGSASAFSQTLIVATPLILTSLAAAIAFRVRLYSVGADGQFVIGAIAGSGVALAIGDGFAGSLAVPLTLGAALMGGALWAAIAGVARAYLGTNVILSTLMLNFIAANLMAYLILGSHSFWRDPISSQPIGKPLDGDVQLPQLFERADVGILLAIGVAICVWALAHRTRWGYEMRVVGDSPQAASYVGIDVRHKIVAVLCISGALAGLAGGIQVANVTEALDPEGLNPGLGIGYAGIVVATLGRLSLLATVPLAVLVGALLNAGPGLQLAGVPAAVVPIVQGMLLLLVSAGQFFISYRLRRRAAIPSES